MHLIEPNLARGKRKHYGEPYSRERDTGQMRCPMCGFRGSHVFDSRGNSHNQVRRRRQCDGCGYRFTTYESISVQFVIDYQI